MSMMGCFHALSPAMLQELLADPDRVADVLFPEDDDDLEGEHIEIGKMWHGLHYLLTGDAEGGEPPWSEVILGGQELGEDLGYGPARFLTPREVASLALALAGKPAEEVASRFNPDAMTAAKVYPEIWDEGDAVLEELLDAYRAVAAFYQQAAANGRAMFLYLV